MSVDLPGAVPEIPVEDIDTAVAYYRDRLGFALDWGDEAGGIAGVSKGACRLFLTNRAFREELRNAPPVVIWLNVDSAHEVDALHEDWKGRGARIVARPESKPWKLREFTVADADGNQFRVFYDFSRDIGQT